MPTRITELTPAQAAQMDAWADRWIEIGLRTGETDWATFERAARKCYEAAGVPWPGVVVQVPSPLVLAFAAPAAAFAIELIERARSAKPGRGRSAVRDAVRDAVRGAVRDAVRDAVEGAVGGAVGGAVRDAVEGAVRDAVRGAVEGAVRGAVRDAVRDAVGGAVGGAVEGAVRDAEIRRATLGVIGRAWHLWLGGQYWVGGWWWGGAWTSFFREVCDLELPGDLWDRGRAYEATMQSAGAWWPHRRFVMVSARPTVIHRELVNPARPRGWGSHRLHCATGPAIAWSDGWALYYWHGVRVTREIIEAPETITAAEILATPNAEIRRIMIERVGFDRFILESGAQPAHTDATGTLYRIDLPNAEPLVLVHVTNATPEPDGTSRKFFLRVPPDMARARQAVAWTFGLREDQYAPVVES